MFSQPPLSHPLSQQPRDSQGSGSEHVSVRSEEDEEDGAEKDEDDSLEDDANGADGMDVDAVGASLTVRAEGSKDDMGVVRSDEVSEGAAVATIDSEGSEDLEFSSPEDQLDFCMDHLWGTTATRKAEVAEETRATREAFAKKTFAPAAASDSAALVSTANATVESQPPPSRVAAVDSQSLDGERSLQQSTFIAEALRERERAEGEEDDDEGEGEEDSMEEGGSDGDEVDITGLMATLSPIFVKR